MNASKQPFVVSALLCVALAGLFAVRFVMLPLPVEAPDVSGMPLASLLTSLTIVYPKIAAGLAAALVVWILFLVVKLSARYAPVTSRNYLPPQIFLIAAGGTVLSSQTLASLLAALLLVSALWHFCASFGKGLRLEDVFRGGLWLGIIPLLYAPAAAIVLLLVPILLGIFQRGPREWVVCLVGLFMSVPAAGFVHWAIGAPGDWIYRELWRLCVEAPGVPYYMQVPQQNWLPAAGVFLMALVGIGWASGNKMEIRKSSYRYMSAVGATFFVLLASVAVPGASFSVLPMVGVVAAVSVPWSFSGHWATLSTLIYCVILASVLALDLGSLLMIF